MEPKTCGYCGSTEEVQWRAPIDYPICVNCRRSRGIEPPADLTPAKADDWYIDPMQAEAFKVGYKTALRHHTRQEDTASGAPRGTG